MGENTQKRLELYRKKRIVSVTVYYVQEINYAQIHGNY